MLGQSRNPRLDWLLQYVIMLLKLNTFCNLHDTSANAQNTFFEASWTNGQQKTNIARRTRVPNLRKQISQTMSAKTA